jgi:hypothetical protein
MTRYERILLWFVTTKHTSLLSWNILLKESDERVSVSVRFEIPTAVNTEIMIF